MKLILFLISITAIVPLTVFAQRERFSDQKEKNYKPSDITRVQPDVSTTSINYQNPSALRNARKAYLTTIKSASSSGGGGGRLKYVRSDAYLFLSPEERSLAVKK
jgi:hypothetical protein